MCAFVFQCFKRATALAILALMPVALSAQAPMAKSSASDSPSRFDIFAGYSYLAPKGTVQVSQANGSVSAYNYDAVNVGGLVSGAYYFNKFVGVQGEFGIHEWGDGYPPPRNVGTEGNDDGFLTVSGGIIFRFPMENITPFVHGLVGGSQIEGPFYQAAKWGPDLTIGGGMDYETPWFNHRLAIRVFQADYEYMHADFGPQVSPPGGRANINAARLSAGCRHSCRFHCASSSDYLGLHVKHLVDLSRRPCDSDGDGRRPEPQGQRDL